MKKACHITSAHSRHDIRIFHKECSSLARAGYEVTLLCADLKSDERKNGVSIKSAGCKPKNRIDRFLNSHRVLLKMALAMDSDIYHFHDPDLLSVGAALRRRGKKVIYDAHEDVPRQLKSKPWVPPCFRSVLSFIFEHYENFFAGRFDHVITATPYIAQRFMRINPNTTDVNNYPLSGEFDQSCEWSVRKDEACYLGGITKIRGVLEMIKALEIANVPLHLCGEYESSEMKDLVHAMPGFSFAVDHGFLPRNEAQGILRSCKAGLVTYLPEENHISAQPNKLFEYMAAGVPVIASDFPLWKTIVEGNNCGFCVDPENPKAIATALTTILSDDGLAKAMGENGRMAVEGIYNWTSQEKKLLQIYSTI